MSYNFMKRSSFHVNVRLDMDEMDLTARTEAERRQATYEKIKKYVAEHNDG